MSKINLNESEKNRILGLHKSEKQKSNLQEQRMNQGVMVYDSPPRWYDQYPNCFDLISVPGGGFNISCAAKGEHYGKPIDDRAGGYVTAVYLGINPRECFIACKNQSDFEDNRPKPLTPKDMSRILEIDIDYTTFQHPCVDMYTYQEGMVRYRCKFGNGLVIADRTVGDFITLEDCCKQGGYRDDEDADSDINPDMTGPDTNTPRKCNWRQEPTELPTTLPYNRKNNIKKCHKGDNVKKIQQKLIEEGFNLGRSQDDGLFGGITHNAVKEYQRKYDLSVDGVVGPETWNHMFPTDEVKGKEEVTPIIDKEEVEKIIEKQTQALNAKDCRTIIIDTSNDIKGFPGKYLEGKWPANAEDESRLETIKYCFNRFNPGRRIPGHARRVKRTFKNNNIYDLKGKGNI